MADPVSNPISDLYDLPLQAVSGGARVAPGAESADERALGEGASDRGAKLAHPGAQRRQLAAPLHTGLAATAVSNRTTVYPFPSSSFP